MTNDQKREAFERMYGNDPVKLARGKYLRQDYDRRETQANWEVFQKAWPIIFAAGMERAAAICARVGQSYDNEWNRQLGIDEDAKDVAEECADAIRAEIPKGGNE